MCLKNHVDPDQLDSVFLRTSFFKASCSESTLFLKEDTEFKKT